jgi:hypothetical protein
MRALALLIMLGCNATDVCSGIDGTCIGLTANGHGAIDELLVILSGGTQGQNGLTLNHTPLPVSVALHLNHLRGPSVQLDVRGRSGSTLVGEGMAAVNGVTPGAHLSVSVTLAPPEGTPGQDLATSDQAPPADLAVSGPDLACSDLQNDPLNCGACGHDCLGGGCVAGKCQPMVLAAAQSGAFGIAVYNNTVYWSNATTAALSALPLSGGAPTQVATGVFTSYLAVSGDVLYGTHVGPSSTIWQMPFATFRAITVATATAGAGGIAADANSPPTLYWADSILGRINKIVGAGSTAIITSQTGVRGLAVTPASTGLVWTLDSGNLEAGSTTGGSGLPFASGQSSPSGIVLDGNNVYWCNRGDGTVRGFQSTPGDLGTPLGGTQITLATGQNAPVGMAVDATAYYWVNGGDGTIMRLAK